jgi:hypothetical protein
MLTIYLVRHPTGSFAAIDQLKAARPAEWLRMYDSWAAEHDRVVTMRRVAVPQLIDAILNTDYGDLDARNDLISRLQESVHSYGSTSIPLGHHGGFEFTVIPAVSMPIEIGIDILPPLPPRVTQAVFQGQSPQPLAYFRLTGQAIRQLWRSDPEAGRQIGYGCWSGEPSLLLAPAPPRVESTGSPAYSAFTGSMALCAPPNDALSVAKHRTTVTGSLYEAEAVTVGASQEASGSLTGSSDSSSSGQVSASSHTTQSSASSHPDSTLPARTTGVTSGSRPGECKMLAAMASTPPALENTVFLYIGALYVRQASVDTTAHSGSGDERAPSASRLTSPPMETDYIFAVNLSDLSVYLIYVAWHDNPSLWEMTEEECAAYAMGPVEYERFKPQNSREWARLPGFEDGIWPFASRRVLARVADSVHEWALGDMSIQFAVGPSLLPSDSVPLLESIWLDD